MPFPAERINNWVQHQIVQDTCTRCGCTFPTQADGTLFTKGATIFTGTPLTNWSECHP